LHMRAKLSIAGAAGTSVQVENISIGGAMVSDCPTLAEGTAARLRLGALDLPCLVLRTKKDGTANLHFPPGAMTSDIITSLRRLAARQAA